LILINKKIISIIRPLVTSEIEKLSQRTAQIKSMIPKAVIKPLELSVEKLAFLKGLDPSKCNDKELKNWLYWWQNHFDTDDYLKYLSTQVNNYNITNIFKLKIYDM
jgi:hypothetical protein